MIPLLSLCMIVKNEEKVLDRCLRSVKGLVDEIIIVDTGSTDRTKEIALAHNAKVVDFEWVNDFAAARNESLKYASGKWILVLDADEYVQAENHADFRTILESIQTDQPNAIMLPVLNIKGASLQYITGIVQSSASRVIYNHRGIKFVHPIHEQLESDLGDIQYIFYSFNIYHTGYTLETRDEKNKGERNMQLHKQLNTKNSTYDSYYQFTLGNEYSGVSDFNKALYYYQKALRKDASSKLWYPELLTRLIVTCLSLDKLSDAWTYSEMGIERYPNAIDYYYFKAQILFMLGLHQESYDVITFGLELISNKIASKQQFWLTSPDYGGKHAYTLLAQIYNQFFDTRQEVAHLSKVIGENLSSFHDLLALIRILKWQEPVDQIVSFVEKRYPTTSSHNLFFTFLVSVYAGIKPLALKSYTRLVDEGFTFPAIDRLQYEFLTNQQDNCRELLTALSPAPETDEQWLLLLCIALLNKNHPDIFKQIQGSIPEDWKDEIQELSSFIQGSATNSSFKSNKLASLLTTLVNYQYYDLYDELLAYFLNPYYRNQVAHYLYAQSNFDLAVDYYQQLLKEDALDEVGCYNLGRLYILDGQQVEEGLALLERTIEMNPTATIVPYAVYCKYATNELKKRKVKTDMMNQYPQYRKIPYLQDL